MSPYTLLITLAVVIHHTSGQGGIYGNCTLDQVNKFRSGLSASCNKIFDKASANPSSLTDEDFNIYCDASCIGVFATFQRNNCSNGLLADVLEVECYKDDGDWVVSQARPLLTPYRYAGEGKGLDKCYSTFRSIPPDSGGTYKMCITYDWVWFT